MASVLTFLSNCVDSSTVSESAQMTAISQSTTPANVHQIQPHA